MNEPSHGGPAYVNAYVNGIQFILLALEGRLEELEDPDKEAMLEAMYEYHELAERMRQRARLGVDR